MAQIIPRPAATLILLRDGTQGPEIFMLKRSPFVLRVGHGPSSMALGPRFVK